MQQALDLRTALLTAGGCSFTAQLCASYDDVRYDFTLDCVCKTDGSAQLTVTAPQTLAGIAASIAGAQGTLEFADTAVAFGLMAGGNLAPMQTPQLLVQALGSDYIRAVGRDGDMVRVTCLHGYDEQELTVDVWLSQALLPQYAEVSYEGCTLVTMQLENFVLLDAT